MVARGVGVGQRDFPISEEMAMVESPTESHKRQTRWVAGHASLCHHPEKTTPQYWDKELLFD